jgi:hypothetical protein
MLLKKAKMNRPKFLPVRPPKPALGLHGGFVRAGLGAPIDGVHYFQLMASSHSD